MSRTGHALMCSGIVSEQPKYPHQPTWPGCERSSLAWKSLKLVKAVMGILTRGMSSIVFFISIGRHQIANSNFLASSHHEHVSFAPFGTIRLLGWLPGCMDHQF